MFRLDAGAALVRWLVALGVLALAAAGALGWAAWRWIDQPLALPEGPMEVTVMPGDSPRDVAQAWAEAGIDAPPWLLYEWFRWSGQARAIRAGTYGAEPGMTPRTLLAMMVQGRELLQSVRLIDGWTLRQWRAELARAPHLNPASAGMDEAQLMAALGAKGQPGEGRFFPDTYRYPRGETDVAVMKRAYEAMARHLEQAWAERAPDSPLKSADELLILASIVEKETGREDERGLVAGVFTNRLRIGMPLQTDPTIIYGLGESFDGNLRRRDLRADGPYNTYTRVGLPPTPIAMPGLASLRAAAKPAETKALFFVARGDGSSQFSETLDDHNRAVNRFQRGR